MNLATDLRPVRIDCRRGVLPKLMSRQQALRHAIKTMPADLKRASFVASVFQSDPEIHGDAFFRINYSK